MGSRITETELGARNHKGRHIMAKQEPVHRARTLCYCCSVCPDQPDLYHVPKWHQRRANPLATGSE